MAIPKAYTNAYNNLANSFRQNVQTVSAPAVDPSALKQQLVQMMRPAYDQQVKQAQQANAANRALIDTDAAARGMGSSTWVTDVKNRNQNQLQQNINGINADYNQNLYGNLLNQLQNQQAMKMQADQYNAGALNDANNAALAAVNANNGWWHKGSGTGGTGAGNGDDDMTGVQKTTLWQASPTLSKTFMNGVNNIRNSVPATIGKPKKQNRTISSYTNPDRTGMN